jgi:N-acetyl-gamma-glutamyl-phosphate reductase
MGMTAAVAGGSGYAGGELLRLLSDHPDLSVVEVYGGPSSTGQLLGDVHPNLITMADMPLSDPAGLTATGADIVFLALPHGASGPITASLPAGTKVVDLGADHRLTDPAAWERGYGGAHAGAWTYGLPELPAARAAIRSSAQVAAPGCYPTAVILGLHPLLSAGLIEKTDLVVVASSGTSGAGRAPKTSLLGAEVMGDLTAYKVGDHQHVHEMNQALGVAALSFTPVLAPLPRGMLATSTAIVRPGVDADALRAALVAAYADAPFVHVLGEGRWPHASSVAGSNSAHLQVTIDAFTGRAVVVSAIDNLGKGAAGQALQCANLMLGLAETAGLAVNGMAP